MLVILSSTDYRDFGVAAADRAEAAVLAGGAFRGIIVDGVKFTGTGKMVAGLAVFSEDDSIPAWMGAAAGPPEASNLRPIADVCGKVAENTFAYGYFQGLGEQYRQRFTCTAPATTGEVIGYSDASAALPKEYEADLGKSPALGETTGE